jgi:Zn-dependent peptidase ImmA (M78 family)
LPRPLRVRYSRIRQLVDGLLTRHRVHEPPVDIRAIAEREGFQISYRRLNDELSGFLLKGARHFVIGVNSSSPETRRRFTIAHECGHAYLHDFDEVHIDKAFKLRSPLSSRAEDVEEIEANTFAAWILMPDSMIQNDIREWGFDVQSDEGIQRLARRYEVSEQSMTFRIANLLSRSRRLRQAGA